MWPSLPSFFAALPRVFGNSPEPGVGFAFLGGVCVWVEVEATTNTTPHNRTPRDRTTTQKHNHTTTSFFRTFSTATHSILVVWQIRDREMNLRTILRLFHIHHLLCHQ